MPAPSATRLSIYSDNGLHTPSPTFPFNGRDDFIEAYGGYDARAMSRVASPFKGYQTPLGMQLGGLDMAVESLPQLPTKSRMTAPVFRSHTQLPSPMRSRSQALHSPALTYGFAVDDSAGIPSSRIFQKSYSLPMSRSGRSGGHWRHIQQITGQGGANILFIDGGIKESDVQQYPPFGVLVPEVNYNSKGQRLLSKRMVPKQLHRGNQFNSRAKAGFQYWYKEPQLNITQPPKQPIQTISGHQRRTAGVGYHN